MTKVKRVAGGGVFGMVGNGFWGGGFGVVAGAKLVAVSDLGEKLVLFGSLKDV